MNESEHNCMNCGHHMKEEDSDTKAFCVFWMDYHAKNHWCKQWTDKMYLEEIYPVCGNCGKRQDGNTKILCGKTGKVVFNLLNTCKQWSSEMRIKNSNVVIYNDDIRVHRAGRPLTCWQTPSEFCTIKCPMCTFDQKHVWFACRSGEPVCVGRDAPEMESADV